MLRSYLLLRYMATACAVGYHLRRLSGPVVADDRLLTRIRHGRWRLLGRAAHGHSVVTRHRAAGLGIAAGGGALHVGWPLNGALVQSRVHRWDGGLALAAPANWGRRVEWNRLRAGRNGKQQAGK